MDVQISVEDLILSGIVLDRDEGQPGESLLSSNGLIMQRIRIPGQLQ